MSIRTSASSSTNRMVSEEVVGKLGHSALAPEGTDPNAARNVREGKKFPQE